MPFWVKTQLTVGQRVLDRLCMRRVSCSYRWASFAANSGRNLHAFILHKYTNALQMCALNSSWRWKPPAFGLQDGADASGGSANKHTDAQQRRAFVYLLLGACSDESLNWRETRFYFNSSLEVIVDCTACWLQNNDTIRFRSVHINVVSSCWESHIYLYSAFYSV